ncbi:MAG TPA: alpha/beta fold hydrolase [Rubrivivax sp.]|nr:alpha/beta fold hydrolase [Rubrivivax sp.]HPO20546.1 alpha/beta fold hydrolase [Rubrivivax sp.]
MARDADAAKAGATSRRLRTEVDRLLQRGLKGLEYLGSPAPVVGTTPKTLLLRRGTLGLYHYKPQQSEIYRVPLLLVMATTNKAYIFDLAPGQSLVEFLLQRGYDVYVMDWNAPAPSERGLRLEDYVLGFIPDCIARVQRHSGEAELTLAGYCFGGVLALLYTALHDGAGLRNLVCFTTPLDFSQMTLFRALSDARHFDVDKLCDRVDLVPAEMVIAGFDALRPAGRIAGQLRLWDNMWNDDYVKGYRMMERWGAETLPLASEYFRQIVKELMQGNALHQGTLRIGARLVELERVRLPLLHVIAQHDHIVPPPCARPLLQRVGSRDKQEVMLSGGHVSLVAGANAVKRMWPTLDQWLQARST